MDYKTEAHDLFMTPPWVDEALASRFTGLSRIDVKIGLLRKQVSLLAVNYRVTSQRVNLFEKVKIPGRSKVSRRIQIFLGDQQTAAVVTGKTAKRNLLRRRKPHDTVAMEEGRRFVAQAAMATRMPQGLDVRDVGHHADYN